MTSPVGPVGECAVLLLKVLDRASPGRVPARAGSAIAGTPWTVPEAGAWVLRDFPGASESTLDRGELYCGERARAIEVRMGGTAARSRMPRPGAQKYHSLRSSGGRRGCPCLPAGSPDRRFSRQLRHGSGSPIQSAARTSPRSWPPPLRRFAARFGLSGAAQRPYCPLEVELAGFRLLYHAVEVATRRRPEMLPLLG